MGVGGGGVYKFALEIFGLGKRSFWKRGLFRKVHFLEFLENVEILEILEKSETLEKKEESDLFLEILGNLERF